MNDDKTEQFGPEVEAPEEEQISRDELGLTAIQSLKLREEIQSGIFAGRSSRRRRLGLPHAFGEGEIEGLFELASKSFTEAKQELLVRDRTLREMEAREAARRILNLPSCEAVGPCDHPSDDGGALTAQPIAQPKLRGPGDARFSDVTTQYVKEKISSGVWKGAKTPGENRFVFSLFIEVIGDLRIDEVTAEHARKMKEVLMTIPANYKKRFPKIPVLEVIAQPDIEPRDTKSINKNLCALSGLFRYAVRHGYCERNFFEKMVVPQKRRERGSIRLPLSEVQVQQLCTSLDSWFPPDSRRQPRSYHFWILLLGMYTGARLNELCQLALDDIQQEDGIWRFAIVENDDDLQTKKTLKNTSSVRLVPIHSHLIELGLLGHVDKLREAGQVRLFPELKRKRDGFGTRVSDWFRYYRRSLGIGKMQGSGSRQVFHCYRHTVSHLLRHSGVPEVEVAAITGHEHKNVTYGNYSRARLDTLAAHIEKLDYGITPAEIRSATERFEPFRQGKWELPAFRR